MSSFYLSPTSNIPSQPHAHAIRMTRTGSSSSTASSSSSISISSPPPSRPGSSSASFSSSYWASPFSSTSTSTGSAYSSCSSNHPPYSRHNSHGTSYLPTPFRSSLLHSSASASACPSPSTLGPSSYFSDDELLSLTLDSTHLTSSSPLPPRELTTEEQVAAVRAQVERERDGLKPEGWWQPPLQHPVQEKRNRVVRFAADGSERSAAGRQASVGGKRKRVGMAKASTRRE